MKYTTPTPEKCRTCHIDKLLSSDDIKRKDNGAERLIKTHHMITRNKIKVSLRLCLKYVYMSIFRLFFMLFFFSQCKLV